jgi:hypothetical protein
VAPTTSTPRLITGPICDTDVDRKGVYYVRYT